MGVIRAVHSTGAEEAAAPDKKTQFFLNIVFEFAELFLVAILLRNHTKINWFDWKKSSFNMNSKIIILENLSR